MWFALGAGLAEGLLISGPSIAMEIAGKGTLWVGKKIYNYYYPFISETEKLHNELELLKFELSELKDNEWEYI